MQKNKTKTGVLWDIAQITCSKLINEKWRDKKLDKQNIHSLKDDIKYSDNSYNYDKKKLASAA